MLQTVVFYLILHANGAPVSASVYQEYEVFSTVPIIECSGWVKIHPLTKERKLIHSCIAEKLYAHMTGEETHVIVMQGIYRT